MDLAAGLAAQASQLSAIEATAVAAAVAYLLLAIRQNIWCWAFAAISTSIYIYLFIAARLYMESVLNAFYLAMAAYGWWSWYFGRGDRHSLPVSTWPVSRHAIAVCAIAFVAAVNGYLLDAYSDAAFPYIDSATTWGAIWTTYLVARKVLENWGYWLVIDGVSVVIYWNRDLQLTALLFVVYLLMIPFGYVAWRNSMGSGR